MSIDKKKIKEFPIVQSPRVYFRAFLFTNLNYFLTKTYKVARATNSIFAQ